MRRILSLYSLAGIAFTACAQPGTLDLTFGIGGAVLTQLSGDSDEARAIAIQEDGRIVVGCYTPTEGGDMVVMRYLENGDPDDSFGASGMVTVPFGPGADLLNALKIQADGKIVIVGTTVVDGQRDIAVARYNTNGTLDDAFNDDGLANYTVDLGFVTHCTNEFAHDILLRPDGRMVVTGYCETNNTSDWFITLGLTPSGAVDNAGFHAPDGFHIRDFGQDEMDDQAFASVLRADGSIVQCGMSVGNAGNDFVITQFDATGAYSNNDYTRRDMGSATDAATSVVELPGGRLVLVGRTGGDWGLAGFTPSGAFDPTFGNGGQVVLSVGSFFNSVGKAIHQPWDKILAVGGSGDTFSDSQVTLLRFLFDGTLDPTFDTDGIVRTFIQGASASAQCVALQADGKIVVAGWGVENEDGAVMVARFENDFTTAVTDHRSAPDGPTVFPVPFSNAFTLLHTSPGGPFSVHNALGRTVITGTTTSERTVVRTDGLAPGTYVVRVGEVVLHVVKD